MQYVCVLNAMYVNNSVVGSPQNKSTASACSWFGVIPNNQFLCFPMPSKARMPLPCNVSRFILLFIYVQVFNIGVCAVCLRDYTEPDQLIEYNNINWLKVNPLRKFFVNTVFFQNEEILFRLTLLYTHSSQRLFCENFFY